MKLVELDIQAPTPVMIEPAATALSKLRKAVIVGSGHDFLARCGDIMRDAGFRSRKDGVANRSWHKTGRAVDYDQTSKLIVIVPEPIGGKQFFRTYLRCAEQDGTQGKRLRVRDMRGFTVDAYLFDLTQAAENHRFTRIPAWKGWQTRYNRREFWHYQYNPEGLTWAAAMAQITPGLSVAKNKAVYGLNDRGPAVREIQQKLVDLRWLATNEVDGIFGDKTRRAVFAFQDAAGLPVDGLVGPNTRKALGL